MSAQESDRDKVWAESRKAVDMAPAALEAWLDTDDSKAAGWSKDGGGETVGDHSGDGSSRSSASRRRI